MVLSQYSVSAILGSQCVILKSKCGPCNTQSIVWSQCGQCNTQITTNPSSAPPPLTQHTLSPSPLVSPYPSQPSQGTQPTPNLHNQCAHTQPNLVSPYPTHSNLVRVPNPFQPSQPKPIPTHSHRRGASLSFSPCLLWQRKVKAYKTPAIQTTTSCTMYIVHCTMYMMYMMVK